jgi:hypothetical protein
MARPLTPYIGPARQCPECGSIYLPLMKLGEGDWAAMGNVLDCSCTGRGVPTVKVAVSVSSVEGPKPG